MIWDKRKFWFWTVCSPLSLVHADGSFELSPTSAPVLFSWQNNTSLPRPKPLSPAALVNQTGKHRRRTRLHELKNTTFHKSRSRKCCWLPRPRPLVTVALLSWDNNCDPSKPPNVLFLWSVFHEFKYKRCAMCGSHCGPQPRPPPCRH